MLNSFRILYVIAKYCSNSFVTAIVAQKLKKHRPGYAFLVLHGKTEILLNVSLNVFDGVSAGQINLKTQIEI